MIIIPILEKKSSLKDQADACLHRSDRIHNQASLGSCSSPRRLVGTLFLMSNDSAISKDMEASEPLRLWACYGLKTPLSSRIKVITNLWQSIRSCFFILLPLLWTFITSGRSSFGGKTKCIILMIIKSWSQNCSVVKA